MTKIDLIIEYIDKEIDRLTLLKEENAGPDYLIYSGAIMALENLKESIIYK